jgi:hypothetical protein
MRLKKNSPVDVIPKKFYRNSKNLELEIERIEMKTQLKDHRTDLVKINEDLTTIVQQLQKNLNKVSEQANDYNKAAEGIYKLIDINLRFYRFSEIDQQFKIMDKNRGETSNYRLQRVLSSIRTLLNTIYESIHYANKGFETHEDIENEVVYLVDLADNFEISIRYFAKYQSSEEDEQIDYFEELNENDMEEALGEIQDDEAEFVKESEKEMEEMFDQMEVT